MRIFIFIAFLSIASNIVWATPQAPDKIIYKGNEYRLSPIYPLDLFFEKNPNKKENVLISSSALWRGYVATYEIADSLLFVKDVEMYIQEEKGENTVFKSRMNYIFGRDSKVKVNWWSGILIVYIGECIKQTGYVDCEDYEEYIVLEIDKGRVVKELFLQRNDFLAFKEKQKDLFKKTPEYENLKGKLLEKKKKINKVLEEKDFKKVDEEVSFILKYDLFEHLTKILE